MGELFGTDGARGVANEGLTPELAFRLGRAGAYVLSREAKHPQIVIGKDTRISGDMLEAALIAGICSVGADVLRVGILPTPGIAYLTRTLEATAGVVISASHNPVADNGIKFFAGTGYKLPDELEDEIERLVMGDDREIPRPIGEDVGRVYEVEGAVDRYVGYLKTTVNVDLSGLNVLVDCANGASYEAAPKLLGELGARVIMINDKPNGININHQCGSTYPNTLRTAVLELQPDLGISFDGDADRAIMVDEKGNIVDGDFIMVICALHLNRTGRLPGSKIVATVMSNLGLHQALRQGGIKVHETRVGDRYVLEEMLKTGAILGGEQSGHIIFLQHNTTGDGLLTALQLLSVLKETGQSLSELAQQMRRLPQVLVNVRVKDKSKLDSSPEVAAAIDKAVQQLGDRGRVLVRPSGTEPLVRVMAEGPDEEELKQVVDELAAVVSAQL